jgi:fatty acid desaturase
MHNIDLLKGIVVSADEKINWYRTPIAKERLRELTQKSDVRGLIQITAHLGLFATTAAIAFGCYLHLHWTVFVAAAYIHCMLAGFLVSAIHELIHGTPFKTRWLNEFFFRLVCLLTWINPVSIRKDHFNHHLVTVHNGLDWENPMPRVYKSWHWLFFWTVIPFNMCLFSSVFQAVWVLLKVAGGRLGEFRKTSFSKPDPVQEKKFVQWTRFHLAVHAVLIAVFLYFRWWPLILLIDFSVFFAPALGLSVGLTQHIGMIYNVPDFRLCARTMLINPVLRFLYWNMNYHIEHHMYAAVPFYNLPALRKELEYDLPEATRGLWAVWKEIRPVVKRQRTDPTCCIIPAVANPHWGDYWPPEVRSRVNPINLQPAPETGGPVRAAL